MEPAPDSSSAPASPLGPRPRLNPHSNSPLNPSSRPIPSHIVTPSRRPSLPASPYARKFGSPHTPNRTTPRTPLAFLTNSPTSTVSSGSSLASSFQLRTPNWNGPPALAGLAPPSPMDLPPSQFTLTGKTKSAPPSSLHIKIPSPSPASLSSSSSDNTPVSGKPSPLDNLDHLHNIPHSPQFIIPSAQLLELQPNRNPNDTAQHSIASPFVNLNLNPSPPSGKPGPLSLGISGHPRYRHVLMGNRRGSALSRELGSMSLDDDVDDDKSDDGHDDNDTASDLAPESPTTSSY